MERQILVVDDSPIILAQVERLLLEEGYFPVLCSTGNAALELAKEAPFDLVITDFHMPGITGLVFLQRLRDIPGHQETPAIILSSEPSGEFAQKARKVGAKAWMSKPIKPRPLVQAVNHLVELFGRKVA